MVQNGPNDQFGQNGLIPNCILAFARPKWTKMVHFGPFWPEAAILVHLGPPTVLWPSLSDSGSRFREMLESLSSDLGSLWGHSGVEPRESLLSHFWVTLILSVFLFS